MQRRLDEVNQEIESISRDLSRTPDDDPKLQLLLTRLWKAHDERFGLLEEPDDIHKVVEYTSILLALTPENDPGMSGLLDALGMAHCDRFKRLGAIEDMERGIEYKLLALALMPDGHPDLPRQLANLSVSHKQRFEHLGELYDIEKAIEYDSQAIALTSDGHQSMPDLLEMLGTSHLCRFWRLGELDDLEKAINHQTRGLALAPDNHLRLPIIHANLATAHNDRFKRLGELNDIEQAIDYGSRAIAFSTDNHPHLPIMLANLGLSYKNRFERLGQLNDLDKSIEYNSRALTLTPGDHPDLSYRLANLGVAHRHRFEHLGELDELDKAIDYGSRAVTLTPDGHPGLPDQLAKLAVSHNDRFKRLGGLDELDKAIDYASRALGLTPKSHPHLPIMFINLGVLHTDRFKYLGTLDDLEKSIEYESRALALTPDGHPDLSRWVANLGVSHSYRFGHRGDPTDLEKAIEYKLCALQLTPDDHPNLCMKHFNLAISYVDYYEHTNSASYLLDSLNSFRVASKSLTGASRDKFYHARQWAKHASKHSALNCIEAYQTTIDLLPHFIWLGATVSQRYEDIKMAGTLGTDAAYAAILLSDYAQALEWLEHTRCIVWNQSLMLRSPLDHLQASHLSLATRLQTVATQLHNGSSDSQESRIISVSKTPEQAAQEHRRLAEEYDNLLTQTRALPGYENFLRPIKSHALVCAAQNGPIVVLNCHQDRCDALIILPKQSSVAHLPLPHFSAQKARQIHSKIESSLRRQGLRERGVHIRREPGDKDEFGDALATLWNDIVKPVLDSIGCTACPTGGSLPHITWCPTGAASFLPLHAAGDYDQPHSRIFDYAISSYTPTLTALLASTPSKLDCDSQVIAIGQEATPGHKLLPGIRTELAYVKSHVENKAGYSQLTDAQATPSAVLDAMEQHDWVHLACHAHQNFNDPIKSGFFLHDGTLDLAELNRRAFKKKGLAFLSACQTAKGDETLPDEAVHLASGMLMAGYSSVIATMWSVVDEDAPFVADKVYSQLMIDRKLGNGEAGKALYNAVAGLRDKIGEKEFGRWVPYIHIGS